MMLLSLPAPLLTTPLLKIPLLVSSAVGTYCGLTPPNAYSEDTAMSGPRNEDTIMTDDLFKYSWQATFIGTRIVKVRDDTEPSNAITDRS